MKVMLLLAFVFAVSFNPAFSQGDCDDPSLTISAQMGLNVEPAGFFVESGAQDGRIFRDGIAAVCPNKLYPGDFNVGTTYNWTAIRFWNDGGPLCITVNVDVDSGVLPCGVNGHGQVYQEATGTEENPYDPTAQADNFVGDVGSSVTQPFSVEVVGGWFEVVFTNTSGQDNCDFSFTIDDGGTGMITCDVPIVGITENALDAFVMYPNPANEYVNFTFPNSIEVSTVEIFDTTGKLVQNSDVDATNFGVSTKSLQAGIYFVKVSSENESSTKKLVIR